MIVQSMLLQALGPEDLFRVLRIPPFAAPRARKAARPAARHAPVHAASNRA